MWSVRPHLDASLMTRNPEPLPDDPFFALLTGMLLVLSIWYLKDLQRFGKRAHDSAIALQNQFMAGADDYISGPGAAPGHKRYLCGRLSVLLLAFLLQSLSRRSRVA